MPVRYEKSTGPSECHEKIIFSPSSILVITKGLKVTFACAVDTQRSNGRARRRTFFIILKVNDSENILYNEANEIDTKSKKK